MCGFVGFSGTENATFDRQKIIDMMNAKIIHRGPDSEGKYISDSCSLGFRRLAMIDLKNGDQPIHSRDGKYVIVFNGEIYNYKDIKKELINNFGCEFTTDSDTEVLLEGYIHYGKEVLSKLRGMFAFVILEKETGKLFGARDFFGIKPFFYTFVDNNFVFASEIKALLEFPNISKEINKDALKMYLVFQYSPLQESIFKGIFRLKPGNYFTYENGEFSTYEYFTPKFSPKKRNLDDAIKLIDETIKESVEYHQVADVEIGSYLSGGVDSSYVVSCVNPMKTYTVGFDIDGFDETAYAKELSDILDMKHSSTKISPDDFFAALPSVQYFSDEPHANLSAVPLYYLSKLARKDLKIVLSGEGADELFGGYDWYIQSDFSKAYKKLPIGIRKCFAKVFGKLPNAHIRRFFVSNAERVEDSYIGQAFIMSDELANNLLNDSYKADIVHQDVTKPYYDDVAGLDDFAKKQYLDMRLWLPGDILLKADRMTMANSLEARVPYLDKEVWEVAKTLTPNQKMKGRHTKIAFRKAALSHIPEDWARRKKAGFLVPFREWIKEEKYYSQVKEMFNDSNTEIFFNKDLLLKILDEHYEGKANNGRIIYTVYSFLIWYKQYFC